MCLGNWVWKWMEFVVGGERFFWLYDLKLGQAMRNLACGDLWIMLVQPVFMACQLSTCVCPFHLVDELVLVFYTAFCWRSFFGGGEQVSMVLVSWELMLFLFIYYFIILWFIYLFLVKGLFTIKYKYYTIFK